MRLAAFASSSTGRRCCRRVARHAAVLQCIRPLPRLPAGHHLDDSRQRGSRERSPVSARVITDAYCLHTRQGEVFPALLAAPHEAYRSVSSMQPTSATPARDGYRGHSLSVGKPEDEGLSVHSPRRRPRNFGAYSSAKQWTPPISRPRRGSTRRSLRRWRSKREGGHECSTSRRQCTKLHSQLQHS